MAGNSCFWNYLLDASLGYREERPSFHSNVHSIGTCYNSHHFSILVEREALLGKVHIVYELLVTYYFHLQYGNLLSFLIISI
jgi:hypothetical protein